MSKLNFQFLISPTEEFVLVPEQRTIENNFDYLGDLLSLKRIDKESNLDYKKRLWDISVNPGDPTYIGIVNELTRRLGLLRGKAFTVDLKKVDDIPIAPNPYLEFLSNKVILYSDYTYGNQVIDKEIKIYKPTDSGYFLDDLVAEIESSECFTATINSDVRPNSLSSMIIRLNSDGYIHNENVPASKKFQLVAKNIIIGSVIFDEKDIFKTEVLTTPANKGEYSFDYVNGIVETFSVPSGDYGISYRYNVFPYTLNYSHCIVYSLQDDNFVDELYQKEELPSSEEGQRLLNTEGSEIIHQLFKETEMFWGK